MQFDNSHKFDNSHNTIDCPACCRRCIRTTASHCSHCPRHRTTASVQFPNESDYSHLVGDPAEQPNDLVQAVPSTELLTDYDRILLRGMHMIW
jgi:hypothetical protein